MLNMLCTLHMCIMIVLNFTWLFACNNSIHENILMLLLHLNRTYVNSVYVLDNVLIFHNSIHENILY